MTLKKEFESFSVERLHAILMLSLILALGLFLYTKSLWILVFYAPFAAYLIAHVYRSLRLHIESYFNNELIALAHHDNEIILSPVLKIDQQNKIAKRVRMWLSYHGKVASVYSGSMEIKKEDYSLLRGYVEKFPELKNYIKHLNMVNRFTYALIETRFHELDKSNNADKQFLLGETK